MRASAYSDTSTSSIVAEGKNVSWLASAIRRLLLVRGGRSLYRLAVPVVNEVKYM